MRWLAVGWITAALTMTVLLGAGAVHPGRVPEWGHLVGHVALCGGLAAMVAAARRGSAAANARDGLAATLAFGVAIEILQAPFGPPLTDSLFDVAVDAVGGSLGLMVWAATGSGRASAVGSLLSVALHPLVLAPLGVAAALVVGRTPPVQITLWVALAAGCVLPAVAVWAAGISEGWWTDADVSTRTERGPLFTVGCAGAVAFASVAATGAEPVVRLGVTGVAGAALGTLLTALGLKVSGHVAIPATLGLLIATGCGHTAIPLLGAAAVLSWARWAAGRHQPAELVAAWLLAGVCAVVGSLA